MDTKLCKKCNINQDIKEFPQITRGDKTYHLGECRECSRSRKRKGTQKRLFNDGVVKECSSCGQRKPHSDFAFKNGKPIFRCKDCHNIYYKDYYSKNSVHVKRNIKKYRKENALSIRCGNHGISTDKYAEMYNFHDGKCWVCLDRAAEQIDHDHSCCPGQTGCQKCVRGLLCGPCNRMLGHANDDPEILKRGIEYLKL